MRVIDWDMHIIRYVYRMRNIKKEDDKLSEMQRKIDGMICIKGDA